MPQGANLPILTCRRRNHCIWLMSYSICYNATQAVGCLSRRSLSAEQMGIREMNVLCKGALWLLILGAVPAFAQVTPEPLCNIYYVDQNATGPVHDGSSWCSGFLGLSDALLIAEPCATIRVAGGVYTPSTQGLADAREATFEILDSMTWEGGYAGCGATSPDMRDFELFETLLSGDLNGNNKATGNSFGNAYNVVVADGVFELATIDGFSIAHGYTHGSGGGIFSNASFLAINHCKIFDNHAFYCGGGGVYAASLAVTFSNSRIYNNTSAFFGGGVECSVGNFSFIDCEISFNTAQSRGGGINAGSSSIVLDRVIVRGNRTSELNGGGGGLSLSSSSASINNSLIVDNRAAFGGGVILFGNHMDVSNSTIVRNLATNSRVGGGIAINSGTADITNSILWGNRGGVGTTLVAPQIDISTIDAAAFSHNDIEGWNVLVERAVGGMGGIGADPLFVDSDGADDVPGNFDDDFRLSINSPCINRGDPTLASPIGAIDLNGNARSVGCRTDIGAYESTKINIDHDYDSDDQITLADFAKLQLFWGSIAQTSNEADAYTCIFDTSHDGEVNLDDLPDFVDKLGF